MYESMSIIVGIFGIGIFTLVFIPIGDYIERKIQERKD